MMILSNKKSVSTGYVFFIIFCILASSTNLSGAELVNIVIRNSADELVIDIKLKDGFTEELKAALSKGIPIDIAFSVSLYEVHNFWFDHNTINKTPLINSKTTIICSKVCRFTL